jgi:hypothetical protein
MTDQPDIFTNVHRGIRRALFELCSYVGRTEPSDPEWPDVLARAHEVLHFVAHHGDNEDSLLLPALRERAPETAARIDEEHRRVEATLDALRMAIDGPAETFYLACCSFTSLYLEHMRFEEVECEPVIRARFSAEEIAAFGARSVARTSPEDRRTMLGYMFAAMPRRAIEAFLAGAQTKMPPGAFAELRAIAEAASPLRRA